MSNLTRYQDTANEPEKPKRESIDERDARMDSMYTFDRGPDADMSVLAYVSRYQDELAVQFFDWRRDNPGGELQDALRRWEVVRFGAQLFLSAHALLRFAVRQLLTRGPDERAALPPSRPKLPPSERLRRFDEAIGKAARATVWPEPKRLTEGEIHDQQATILGRETE